MENEIRINLLGLMNTHIAAARQMVKQKSGGRILGAGSIASYRTAGTKIVLIHYPWSEFELEMPPCSHMPPVVGTDCAPDNTTFSDCRMPP